MEYNNRRFNCLVLHVLLVSCVHVIGQIRPAHPLTPQEKEVILRIHNNLRSSVNPPAANMRVLRWSPELAQSAARYAQQCVFTHGQYRPHSRYPWVGENLYIRRGARDVVRAMSRWESERNYYNFQADSCGTRNCGHYTQMVWAETSEVGCEIALCNTLIRPGRAPWRNAYNLVCHYGVGGNVRGFRPYVAGQPCTRCQSQCIQNMCNV